MWQQGCLLLQTGKQMSSAWSLGSDLLNHKANTLRMRESATKQGQSKEHGRASEMTAYSGWAASHVPLNQVFWDCKVSLLPGSKQRMPRPHQKQESPLNHNNLRITETSESLPAAWFKAVVPVLPLHPSSTLNPSSRLPQFHFKDWETQNVKQVL